MKIEAFVGQSKVTVIDKNTVQGAPGLAYAFNEVVLKEDGQPYVRTGSPEWMKFKYTDGSEKEEHASVFTFRTKGVGTDGKFIGHTYRDMPQEAIQSVVVPPTVPVPPVTGETSDQAYQRGFKAAQLAFRAAMGLPS